MNDNHVLNEYIKYLMKILVFMIDHFIEEKLFQLALDVSVNDSVMVYDPVFKPVCIDNFKPLSIGEAQAREVLEKLLDSFSRFLRGSLVLTPNLIINYCSVSNINGSRSL